MDIEVKPAPPAELPQAEQDLRAQVLADLEKDSEEKDEKEPETVEASGEEDKPEDDDEEEGKKAAEEEKKIAAAEKAESEKEDPQVSKRLEAVHRAERRAKDAVAKERQAFDRERAEWTPRIEAAQKFEAMQARAKSDPVSALMALGVTEDDLEHVAKQAFLRSKAALADPKLRAEAERAQRERQAATVAEKALRDVEEMRRELHAERQSLEAERRIGHYLGRVSSSADDSTPLVKRALDKNAEKTRGQLRQVAELMAAEYGEAPEPKEVVTYLEKALRSDLEELGIDLSTIGKTTKQETPVAGEKRTAKTISNDLGNPTQSRTAQKTPEEERADVLRALESGLLE